MLRKQKNSKYKKRLIWNPWIGEKDFIEINNNYVSETKVLNCFSKELTMFH